MDVRAVLKTTFFFPCDVTLIRPVHPGHSLPLVQLAIAISVFRKTDKRKKSEKNGLDHTMPHDATASQTSLDTGTDGEHSDEAGTTGKKTISPLHHVP